MVAVLTDTQSFNSTLVQLKGPLRVKVGRQKQSFNSTLVQLKELKIRVTGNCSKCFNSTLVQLKVEEVKRGQDDLIMFQFYLSSIKSR